MNHRSACGGVLAVCLAVSCGSSGAGPTGDGGTGPVDGAAGETGTLRDGAAGDTGTGSDATGGQDGQPPGEGGAVDASDDRTAPPGTQLYMTQAGAGTMDGSSCANAHPVSWFNDGGSWGSGTTQIGPGAVVHLCGTFTGTADTTLLTTQGSGAAGKPITLYFEPGAVLTAPYWRGNDNPGGGAIDASTASYFTIDGGQNGTIECSANGTGMANQQGTLAISMGSCTHCEVTNLTIQNMYVRTGNLCEIDQTEVQAISFQAGASDVTVDNVLIHDVGWAISSNASNTTIGPNVEIYNIDHGFIFGAGNGNTVSNVVFHDNHVHDFALWDTTAATDCYHHDGIHGFGGTSGVVTDFTAYNNLFDGQTGDNFNEHIFLEGTNDGTPWTTSPNATSHIFNNVFSVSTTSLGIAGPGPVAGNEVWANNTLTGSSPSTVSTCEGFGSTSTIAPGAVVENNAVQNCGVLIGGTEAGPGETSSFTVKTFDYNAYASCHDTYNCFFITVGAGVAIDTASFATWQTMSGYDAHSVADLASGTYFALDATFRPMAASPLIGAGDNLTSLCTGSLAPLCMDKAGKPRPTSGAWDIGAYQH
jgi:hypothetical protein